MSVHIYQLPDGEKVSQEFTVLANQQLVPVQEAYVSAYPFNRRWPGHQRSQDQRKLTWFISFDMTGPVQLKITPASPWQECTVRPAARKIKPLTQDGMLEFTIDQPGGYTLDLDNKQQVLHIFANPPQEYQVDLDSENTIYFPAGLHDAGLIELKSNQTLFLDEGAVLFARILARQAENIRILGRGILDNSRCSEEILFKPDEAGDGGKAVLNAVRHHTIRLEQCRNITIDGIIIRDSLVYNIAPYDCDNFIANNIKIIGCWRYNSDGINMHASRNCRVSNCFIRSYDDSICVKGLDESFAGEVDFSGNILVENCVIWNDWGKCLEIGAETKADEISNIIFRNCDLIHLTGPVLDIFNVDHADIHQVAFANITVEYDAAYQKSAIQKSDADVFDATFYPDYQPALISLSIEKHHEYSHGRTRRGKIHDISFKNIQVLAPQMPPSFFSGYDAEHMTRDITLENLTLNGRKVNSIKEANITIRDFVDGIQIK